MTDQQINKAIAEKVMGIDNLVFSPYSKTWMYKQFESKGSLNYMWQNLKDYANDLNAAFEAWDKARLANPHDFNDFTVTAIMDAYTVSLHDVLVAAPNPAKALCLAILAALETK